MKENADAPGGPRLRSYLVIVAVGAFATTFAQQRSLGNFPILFHLKERLHFSKQQVSEFFLWATFAWSLKPLAGVAIDAFPLFGSRRRSYLILGGAIGAAGWAALGFAGGSYSAFLAASIVLNCGMVIASTAMGGLQVETGQIFRQPGRVSSLRFGVMSVAQVVGPLLGGWLARQAFGATAGIGAAVLLALALFALLGFREVARPVSPDAAVSASSPPVPRYRPSGGIGFAVVLLGLAGAGCMAVTGLFSIGLSLFAMLAIFLLILGLAMARVANPVLVQAQAQLSQILRSRTLWMAVAMLFLVYVVPGLNTALTYRQSDELHFSKSFIGTLSSVEGAASVVFTLLYAAVCGRLRLRTLIVIAIVSNVGCTLLFLGYRASTALPIHALTGAFSAVSEVALMDLAVRSTPIGCEALGFSLMLSVRNFGIAMSDVGGSKLMDQYHLSFNTLVVVNAVTTAAVLLFVPLLPAAVVLRKEGEPMVPAEPVASGPGA